MGTPENLDQGRKNDQSLGSIVGPNAALLGKQSITTRSAGGYGPGDAGKANWAERSTHSRERGAERGEGTFLSK